MALKKKLPKSILITDNKAEYIPIPPKPILLLEFPFFVNHRHINDLLTNLRKQIKDYHILAIEQSSHSVINVRILSVEKINEVKLKELEIKLDSYVI
jgi:hypothetical protein